MITLWQKQDETRRAAIAGRRAFDDAMIDRIDTERRVGDFKAKMARRGLSFPEPTESIT